MLPMIYRTIGIFRHADGTVPHSTILRETSRFRCQNGFVENFQWFCCVLLVKLTLREGEIAQKVISDEK